MSKVNVIKQVGGTELLSLISAFKADNNIYVIFDSEKIGSMGLPIIYVSKYTEKLEKISDANEWQSVKNYLKGIINGTSFQYVKLADNINADEVYFTPLTLPQASFDLIKGRYVVMDNEVKNEAPVLDEVVPVSSDLNTNLGVNAVVNGPLDNPVNPVPVSPMMPDNNVASNAEINTNNLVQSTQPSLNIDPQPTSVPVANVVNVQSDIIKSEFNDLSGFETDKETFLKACENMFDALISKYQKQLLDLENREKALLEKEREIEIKMKNASEHLANAEARETVANIAHDNAQRVMDLTNLMPTNPNNPTGVI